MEVQQMLQHMAAHLESYYKPQGPRATDWFERLTAAYEHANAVLEAAAAEPAQVEKAATVAASAVQRVYQGVNQSLKNMRWLVEQRMPSLSYLNSGRVMAILEQPGGLELQDQHGDKHYPDKVAFDDGCNLPTRPIVTWLAFRMSTPSQQQFNTVMASPGAASLAELGPFTGHWARRHQHHLRSSCSQACM